jgi:predicted DNA-binding transcriptional regulator YafY
MPDFKVDEITWKEEFTPERLCFLDYCDNEGVATQRFVLLACTGIGSNGYEYLGAFDRGRFKTFRVDRVRRIEELASESDNLARSNLGAS